MRSFEQCYALLCFVGAMLVLVLFIFEVCMGNLGEIDRWRDGWMMVVGLVGH